jgi:5-methylcytosine-specific restriction protein B
MNYWHIQMNQPWGRDEIKINSKEMLELEKPVIGTGEWDDIQCKYFKDEVENGIKIGDIILVREGKRPIALSRVVGENFKDEALEDKFKNKNFRHVEILEWLTDDDDFPQAMGTLERLVNDWTSSYMYINTRVEAIEKAKSINEISNVLYFKKQIILQGPPGTGKTRMADLVAKKILKENKLTADMVRQLIHTGMEIQTATGYSSFRILGYSATHILIKLVSTETEYKIPIADVLTAYNNQIWLNAAIKNGYDTYTAAMAKFIFDKDISTMFLKTVQFHPSYTYEDFVRGIKANTEDGQVFYETKNMLLGEFAAAALENYLQHQKEPQTSSKEVWANDLFRLFIDHVDETIANESNFQINSTAYVTQIEDDAFRYKGELWAAPHGHRMKFADIIALFLANTKTRKEIKSVNNISGLAKQHPTYFLKMLEKFREFTKSQPSFVAMNEKVPLKNFVLIIDEINRANLSSVLGELIYSLEYRGNAIDSIYSINNDRKIILPPNLYIIGTMNTADRSVGNIDYAIRRRFAFIDVLPSEDALYYTIQDKEVYEKALKLYRKVTELFADTYLASDFEPKQVQLGHSYFLASTLPELKMKLQYEIKPILNEYVRDGILIGDSSQVVKSLEI